MDQSNLRVGYSTGKRENSAPYLPKNNGNRAPPRATSSFTARSFHREVTAESSKRLTRDPQSIPYFSRRKESIPIESQGEGSSSMKNPSSRQLSSKSRYMRSRKRDDDDLSSLSYSTPIISNTTNQAKIGGGNSSVLTPVGSDTTPLISNVVHQAVDDAKQGVSNLTADSNANKPSHDHNSSGDNGVAAVKENTRKEGDRKNNVNSRPEELRNYLFKIHSGKIPDQLASVGMYSDDQRSSNRSSLPDIDERSSYQPSNNVIRSTPRIPPSHTNGTAGSLEDDIEEIRNEMALEDKNGMCANIDRKFDTVMPFIICTLSLIQLVLSSYAALSCRFITCNIGFKPVNVGFKQSELELGFWSYYGEKDGGSMACLSYPTDFSSMFIAEDSTWLASRIVGVISIVFRFLVLLLLIIVVGHEIFLLLVINPDKYQFIEIVKKKWKDCCLFFTILLLLWELAKFVFASIGICLQDKWMNNKAEMVAAEGCTFSKGGRCAIAAIFFDITILLMLSYSYKLRCQQSRLITDDMTPLTEDDAQRSARMILGRLNSEKEKNSDSSGSSRQMDTPGIPKNPSSRHIGPYLRNIGDSMSQSSQAERSTSSEHRYNDRQLSSSFKASNGDGSYRGTPLDTIGAGSLQFKRRSSSTSSQSGGSGSTSKSKRSNRRHMDTPIPDPDTSTSTNTSSDQDDVYPRRIDNLFLSTTSTVSVTELLDNQTDRRLSNSSDSTFREYPKDIKTEETSSQYKARSSTTGSQGGENDSHQSPGRALVRTSLGFYDPSLDEVGMPKI